MKTIVKLLSIISKRIISLSPEIANTKDVEVKKLLETELQVWKMVKDKLEWDILSREEKQASRIKTLDVFRNGTGNIQNIKIQESYIYMICYE